MDIQEKQAKWKQERPLFETAFIHSHLLPFFNFNENTGDYEIKSEFAEDEDRKLAYEILNTGWAMWLRAKRAKAQAVPEESKHEGGYYLQDCRGYIGNCMKFWYTHGYGAKLHNFHWFPTLDDALKAAGGAPWHKPWYAPYVDSLAEKTIDMQLADREQEKAMIEAQEPAND